MISTQRLALTALALSACTLASGARAPTNGQVSVSTKPARIFVERGDAGQQLNFEFVVANGTDEELYLNKIELSVFDSAGKLVRREFHDEYGRPSLELAPVPRISGGRSQMLFNPFHTFAPNVPLARLRYEFSLRSKDRKREVRHALDVTPIAYETKTSLVLPMRGRVLVWDGHDYHAHHRRRLGAQSNPGRYSYDLVLVDEQGSIHKGPPRSNDDWYQARPDTMSDYYSLGAPVFAAGAGRVVRVKDSNPDDRTWNEAELATDENAPAGNYIVIDHLNGEFSVFAHIKQSSARVKVGQMVQQGDTIAAVGASGSSLFQHLHYELRTGAGTKDVEGLPSYFTNFRRLLGSRSLNVAKGTINTGDLVDWQQ